MNLREEPLEKLTLHQAVDALNDSTALVKGLLEQRFIASYRR